MPITTDLPDVLNIFLINFLDSFSKFSKIEFDKDLMGGAIMIAAYK